MDVIEKPAQTPEQWVALACGTAKHYHKFLLYLHVIDGAMYASNARRLHWVKTEFPDGVYDPISFMPVNFDNKVPDFKSRLPDFGRYQWTPSDTIEDAAPGPGGEDVLSISTEIRVNKKYLLEAINGDLSNGVFFRVHSALGNRVAGMSNFGYYMLACIVDK